MKCPICGKRLGVAAEFVEARTEDGVTAVYVVTDLMCTNEECGSGRLRLPLRRIRRPLNLSKKYRDAVSCCGTPLVYITGDRFWVRDDVEHAIGKDGKLSVSCSQCGRSYRVDIDGLEQMDSKAQLV